MPTGRADDGAAEDDPRYDDDDEVQHAAWLSDIRAGADADDDEYCDTADDLRATPAGPRLTQAGAAAEDADRAGRGAATGGPDTPDGAAGPGSAPGPGGTPAAGPGPADTGVLGWPSSAGLAHAPRPPASQPHEDGPPGSAPGSAAAGSGAAGSGAAADNQPKPGPFPARPDRPQAGGPLDSAPGAPTRPADGAADRPPGGPTAAVADVPSDLASRTGLTDTMAAELAGWAAGELPGQASARLAAWASVGGAVARGRRQAPRGGGSTAAERVR